MKKKILTQMTTTRVISTPGKVKPACPNWQFVNKGVTKMIINGNFPLLPGESFGFSSDALIGFCLANNIEMVNDTQFEVEFFDASAGAGTNEVFTKRQLGIGHLIETFMTLTTK